MMHIAWIITSCVLKMFLGERGFLYKGSCPIYPFLVTSLISNKLELLMNRLFHSLNASPSINIRNIRSLMSPEIVAFVAIGLETIRHWAMLAAAAKPMSSSSRRSWRIRWKRHVV